MIARAALDKAPLSHVVINYSISITLAIVTRTLPLNIALSLTLVSSLTSFLGPFLCLNEFLNKLFVHIRSDDVDRSIDRRRACRKFRPEILEFPMANKLQRRRRSLDRSTARLQKIQAGNRRVSDSHKVGRMTSRSDIIRRLYTPTAGRLMSRSDFRRLPEPDRIYSENNSLLDKILSECSRSCR